MLKLSDFNYNLPKELIAQYPLRKRDAARLLVLNRKKGLIEHRIFKDITGYLCKDDLLVLNDTKVLPARLKGQRLTGGKIEILLLNRKKRSTFNALVKPSRIRLGEKIIFNSGKIFATLIAKNEVLFSTPDRDKIYRLGTMPLPPYIRREPENLDHSYYQTIYAKEEGAIASPTAGLHFSKKLIQNIRSQGTNIAYITLHVGYATFRPLKYDDITQHKMEPEYFKIPEETSKALKNTKLRNGRVFAVGTTSCRALESSTLGERRGYTDLFIYPGYQFKVVDCLVTNFHLPRTTLFMLVCAFAGEKLMKKAYREASDKKYRFYSYGDAMLII